MTLLLLDLDRFKEVNASLGHDVGDLLLQAVAGRLTGIDTAGGLVARLGGDEFAILARVPDSRAANELSLQTAQRLREPIALGGLHVLVTASIGVALWNGVSDSFTDLLRHAEAAMYDAKRRGNTTVFYNDQGQPDEPEQLHLLADFREALRNPGKAGIAMQYQPQIDLATGDVDGFEALLRWTHPDYGAISPSIILSICEYTPVVNELTARVIDDVTAQLANWRRQGLTPRVAINVSARDLFGEEIVQCLREKLEQHEIPPKQLQVEVTESALMADPELAREMVYRIAAIGIDISLDDFGTGYSSLEHLRQMPLSELKVDRTFVDAMQNHQDDKAIVASMIDMAHALGLRAVAEGVGDEPTRRMLVDLGCDLGQGWHFSHAVPADQAADLYQATPVAGDL